MRDRNQTRIRSFGPQIATCCTLLIAAWASPSLAAEPMPSITAGLSISSSQSFEPPADRIWLTLEGYQDTAVAPGKPWNDLLDQLRRGFSITPVMNSRVEAELNWFVRHPEYLNRVFNRAQQFLPHIVAQIEANDLPLELALLPMVESAYDPFAYSHGRAAGLWQIIPGTAKRFGIRQNWWYDGRRDVVDSTRGALAYLAYLHKFNDGDWLRAIASYNSGEGNVRKAVRRNRARSKPIDFWNLKLSRETSAYVPRLMALVEIVRDPAAYGVTLPEIINEPQFVSIEIGSQLDLALAAELAGLTLDNLYQFNSGLNRWATDPAGPHQLLVPIASASTFGEALAEVPENERVRWKRHKVRNGEAISVIAEKYHTTLAAIRSANGMRNNTIRAGSYLMIPIATRQLSDYNKSADERRAKTQNRQRKGNRVDYVVASGDSFWSIGQRFGVGTRALASWNGMAPRDTLSIGQKLVIWTSKAPPGSAATRGITRKLRYTVRRGDSLYLIASRFRITVSDLVRWNKIDKSKILRPGQKLTMYVDVRKQSS